MPTRWNDGKKHTLESRTDKIFAALILNAAVEKDRSIQRDLYEKEKLRLEVIAEQRAKELEKLEALKDAERRRISKLIQDANDWEQSRILRAYIQSRKKLIHDLSPEGRGSEIQAWADWAHAQADRIDPLTESPPSILDEVVPYLDA